MWAAGKNEDILTNVLFLSMYVLANMSGPPATFRKFNFFFLSDIVLAHEVSWIIALEYWNMSEIGNLANIVQN